MRAATVCACVCACVRAGMGLDMWGWGQVVWLCVAGGVVVCGGWCAAGSMAHVTLTHRSPQF